MIFFINDADFRQSCSAVNADFSLDSISTYIESVEIEIEKLIGVDTCAAVLADAAILKVMRRCIADLSLASYASSGAIMISDAGIQVAVGTNRAPASDKKLMAFKRDAIERGWSTFEQVIVLLERSTISIWKDSDYRKSYLSSLFAGSSEFGPFGGVAISSSVYMRFRNTIVNVQDDYLEKVLGRDLLDTVVDFNINPSTDTKDKQLQRLCMRVVAPQVVADALRYNAVELGDNGVYQSAVASGADNIESKNSASSQLLVRTINRLTMESEACLVKLNKFLKENSDKYVSAVASVYPVQGLNDGSDNVYML